MKLSFTIDHDTEIEVSPEQTQFLEKGKDTFFCIKDGKKIIARLKSFDRANKVMRIRIEGHTYEVQIKDELDRLIDHMGLANIQAAAISEIKAPMPGLVLDILTKPGDEIEEGTSLLVLEAMKMENVIQSTGVGVIDSIEVVKGEAVEKGQLLIKMQ